MESYRYHSISEARSAYCLRLLRYLGVKEGSTEHQSILDDYNTLARTENGLPRGHKAVKSDDWCAIFAAGQAHAMGLTHLYPMECSCGKIIEIAKGMGVWVEDDGYVPVPGDWVLYAWKGQAEQENTLPPNHIGTVYSSDGEKLFAVEGNKGDMVDVRVLTVGDKRIRGFVHPDYSPLIGDLVAPEVSAELLKPVVYHRLEEVPGWGFATVEKLAGRDWLLGVGGDDLALTEDLLRTLVVLDRAGVWERRTLPG